MAENSDATKVKSMTDLTKNTENLSLDNDFKLLKNNIEKKMFTNNSWKKHWLTDNALQRFLCAFGSVSNASQKLVQYFNWRFKEKIDDIDADDPIIKEILQSKANLIVDGVHDSSGRPIIIITARNHKKTEQAEEIFKSAIYCIEKLCEKCDETKEKNFCMVYDLGGLTKANMDLMFCQRYFKCLKNYYPERVGVGLIINYPTIAHQFWKLVKVCMNRRLHSKFMFCGKEEFRDFVDIDKLPLQLFSD